MNRMFLVLLIAFTSLSFSYSQQIEIKKVFGENRFYQDGKRLYMKDVIILMENNKEALLIMKKARQNMSYAACFYSCEPSRKVKSTATEIR